MYPKEGMLENEFDPRYAFITRYDITSPRFVLKYGIKVGMTRNNLLSILEEPNLSCPKQDEYAHECGGAESNLIIRYENDRISRIIIQNWGD
jgi:hypothetical protein